MKKVLWQELRRPEIEKAARDGAVVIIPTGSTEQHGNHLPVNTDANCCSTIARRAAQAVVEFPVLVLPIIWTGYSPHHMDFSGTITLTLQTFIEVLTQVASSIYAHGFKKMLFLNGHGGNGPMIKAMRRELAAREGISIVGYEYWQLPGVNEEMRAMSESDKGVIGHAGEMETSLELYLQPELVDITAAQCGPGVKGDPAMGTRQKGERLVNTAVNGLIKVLRDCHSGVLEERLTLFRKDIVIDERFRPVG